MRYKITFFKLSKTRRPSLIASGIEEKSFFNKMIDAVLKIGINNVMLMKLDVLEYAPASLATSLPLFNS